MFGRRKRSPNAKKLPQYEKDAAEVFEFVKENRIDTWQATQAMWTLRPARD